MVRRSGTGASVPRERIGRLDTSPCPRSNRRRDGWWAWRGHSQAAKGKWGASLCSLDVTSLGARGQRVGHGGSWSPGTGKIFDAAASKPRCWRVARGRGLTCVADVREGCIRCLPGLSGHATHPRALVGGEFFQPLRSRGDAWGDAVVTQDKGCK